MSPSQPASSSTVPSGLSGHVDASRAATSLSPDSPLSAHLRGRGPPVPRWRGAEPEGGDTTIDTYLWSDSVSTPTTPSTPTPDARGPEMPRSDRPRTPPPTARRCCPSPRSTNAGPDPPPSPPAPRPSRPAAGNPRARTSH
ncbi:vegetative cell wall protein gp1-like [Ooceraea biroi]|uniref:vegetative cell wall protein gp1-like n=1 Tax=Ooceraea biroi TaxID=2015173 RepID=UPI000F07D71B|nr:vegetative cell wall protein gp1-like [Ooceraea biroi]